MKKVNKMIPNDKVEIVNVIVMGESEPRIYVTEVIDFEDNTFSFIQDGSQNRLTFPMGSFIISKEISREELENLSEKDTPKLTK